MQQDHRAETADDPKDVLSGRREKQTMGDLQGEHYE